MKKFLAKFMGSTTSAAKAKWESETTAKQAELRTAGIKAWGAWVQENEKAIVDFGTPLGKTKLVNKNGVSEITNNDTAYVIVQAESHEAAAKMFIGHPHFTIFPGDSVQVMECLPLPTW